MFNFHLTYQWLHWRRPTEPPPALPEGIERLFFDTPSGRLEVLYAAPRSSGGSGSGEDGASTRTAPIVFAHGGMGSAWVWCEYLSYLSARGVPCYAVSLRGHGESWHPSFLRMVYGTTRARLAEDLAAGVRWVMAREAGAEVLLVGHSSGGGLSQGILSDGLVKVKGLALLGAVPGFGSLGVYLNWWRLDPWFSLRMIFHGWHPNSPLSHPALTKAVFFSDGVSDTYLAAFQRRIAAYESFWWPLSMMKPFVDAASVVRHITGWGSSSSRSSSGGGGGGGESQQQQQQRLLVMVGSGDRIMTLPIMRQLAATYRAAYTRLVGEKKLDGGDAAAAAAVVPLEGDGGMDDAGEGVRFAVVPGAGHHLQNDVMWEVGARKLLGFYDQL